MGYIQGATTRRDWVINAQAGNTITFDWIPHGETKNPLKQIHANIRPAGFSTLAKYHSLHYNMAAEGAHNFTVMAENQSVSSPSTIPSSIYIPSEYLANDKKYILSVRTFDGAEWSRWFSMAIHTTQYTESVIILGNVTSTSGWVPKYQRPGVYGWSLSMETSSRQSYPHLLSYNGSRNFIVLNTNVFSSTGSAVEKKLR